MSAGLKDSCGKPADICVVNTCSVTQRAENDSVEAIRKLNQVNPQSKIFVTGCSAQNSPEKLKLLEGVSCVLGNNQKENLADFVLANEKPLSTLEESPGITEFLRHTRAFLKVQDGCNNGCSYCIIPKLRGASRSRPQAHIMKEARNLAAHGYKEVVLCGVCLGDYGKEVARVNGLVKLIESLEQIDGLMRIRLSSIEATDVSPELIEKMRTSKKVCHHLHIPFQSGDDAVLKLMNRKTNADDYRKLIFDIRKAIPDIGITTDIMAGFPGEKEENFNNSLTFLKEIQPSRMHIFSFSPRNHTAASTFKNKVEPRVIKERAKLLRGLAKEFSLNFHRAQEGKTLKVLVEASLELKNGLSKGYSDTYIKVFLQEAQHSINTIVTAKMLKPYRDGIFALPLT